MRTPHPIRTVLGTAVVTLATLFAPAAVLSLSGCDASGPTPADGPPPLDTLPADQQAAVVAAFQDIEALFALGTGPLPRRVAPGDWRAWIDQVEHVPTGTASARLAPDTTLYTGVYDAANTKGYLATLGYREPQGVGVWTARLQHARPVDNDGDPVSAPVDAVETVDLTFLTGADLAAFLATVEAGANAYLVGTSGDAEAAFTSDAIDVWRVAQVYSPAEGAAVVTYANAELRETVTIRDPVVTRNANGTGTVRDGGPDGSVRTRYFGADFAVAPDGTVSGTLDRTLTTSGDVADGALISRTDYAADGTFMQTRQRGGDGVVIREVEEG